MGQRITTFTFSARHPVQFCFTCEQCGRDSGWQTHVFSRAEKVDVSGWNATLSTATQKEYQDKANELVKADVAFARKRAEEHVYPFKDKCPFCGKSQSWRAKGIWWYCFAATASAAAVPLAILWMASALNNDWAKYVIIGLSAAALLISFIYVLTKKVKAAKVKHKQLPVINWNGQPETGSTE